jgi:NitT/TauT family transport system permease protein
MKSGGLSATGNLVALCLLIFVSWELLYFIAGDIAMRSPAETLAYGAKLLRQDTFWVHVAETGKAFAFALALAIAGGLAIGFTLGLSRLASEVFEPMLVAIYSIPKITLYPILLLAFGLGISAKIAFGTLHGIIPIALFTINGVRNVKPVLLKSARTLGLSPFATVREIVLPAALPEIVTGLRVGFSLTMIGTLLGEMFASQRGLGFMLMNAIGLHNVDLIMALTFGLVVFAATAGIILLAIDRRLHHRSN